MRTGASVAFLSPPLFPWATLSYQFAFPFAHLIAFSGKRSELNKNKPRGRTRCWVPSIPRVSLLLGRGWQSRVAPRCAGRDAFRQGWRHRGSVTSRSPPRLLFPPFPPPRAPSPSSRPLPLRAPPAAPRAQLQERPQLCAAPLGTASPFSSPSSSFPPSLLPSGRPAGGRGSPGAASRRAASRQQAGSIARPRWRQETFWAAEAWAGSRGSGPPPSSAGTGQRCGVPGTAAALLALGGTGALLPLCAGRGKRGGSACWALPAASNFVGERDRGGSRRSGAVWGAGGAGPGRAGGTRCSRAHLGERQRPGSARGAARSWHASATTAVRCWLRGFLLQLQSGAEFAKHLNRAANAASLPFRGCTARAPRARCRAPLRAARTGRRSGSSALPARALRRCRSFVPSPLKKGIEAVGGP